MSKTEKTHRVFKPVIISLPIADRQVSYDFYSKALGLKSIGELAEDGIPEPLQFEINQGLRLLGW